MIDEAFDRLDELIERLIFKQNFTEEERDKIVVAINDLVYTLGPMVDYDE